MLGEAVSMLVPQVVGFRLTGRLPDGSTATDLVLTVTQILRELGVVGKFVEYFGAGLAGLPVADRATLGNMSPEYGATCGFFPVDDETLDVPAADGPRRGAGRARRGLLQGEPPLARPGRRRARRTRRSSSSTSAPSSRASPGRGARRTACRCATRRSRSSRRCRPSASTTAQPRTRPSAESFPASDPVAAAVARPRGVTGDRTVAVPDVGERSEAVWCELDGERFPLDHGAVVIAAITSCTNTSNPQVMVAAGLLAKKAVERGLARRPWVKSSLAPGSKVVTQYLDAAGLSTHTSTSSASTRSGTAARRASATRGRSPTRSRARSTKATSPSSRCCPGTGTSRPASTRR